MPFLTPHPPCCIEKMAQAYRAKYLRPAATAHEDNEATLAALNLRTVARDAAAFGASTDPHADLVRVCDTGKGRPFVWFLEAEHLTVLCLPCLPCLLPTWPPWRGAS